MRQQTASDLKGATVVRGWEPEQGCTLEHVLGAAHSTGCQASALGQAIVEVNRMVCLSLKLWLFPGNILPPFRVTA